MPSAMQTLAVRPLGAMVQALQGYADAAFKPPSNTIRGIDADSWYSPLQPMQPFAPEGTEPRGFQYWAGQNLLWTPRPDAEYSASYLKYLATYPLARIAIENVKNSIITAAWEIVPRPQPGETRRAAAKRGVGDKTLVKISRFFEMPDREHTWPEWCSPLIDDALVIDAMTVLLRRTFKGDVAELAVLRGEMITRYIDENGFTPMPPDPAYAQLWWGMPLVNLTTDQLVYKPRKIVPRNTISSQLYGMSETEQLAEEIKVGIARLAFNLAYYEEGSVPGAVQIVRAGVSPDKISQAMSWMNSELAGNLTARRQWRMIQGFNEKGDDQILFPKEPLLADPFDEMHTKKIMFGYGVSPARLGKTMNRASAEKSEEASDVEGILPVFASLKSFLDYIIQRKMGFIDYEIMFDPIKEPDPLKQAQVLKIMVGEGIFTRNEAREKVGEDSAKEPEADQLMVTTGSGAVPIGLPAAQAGSSVNETTGETQGGANGAVDHKGKGRDDARRGAAGNGAGGPEPKPGDSKTKANGHALASSERTVIRQDLGGRNDGRAQEPPGQAAPARTLGFLSTRISDPVVSVPGRVVDLGRGVVELEKRADLIIHPGKLAVVSVAARARLRRALGQIFSEMKRTAVRVVGHALTASHARIHKASDDDAVLNQTMNELAGDWERVANAATPELQAAALAGANAGVIQLGITSDDMIARTNDVASTWAKDRAAELVGMHRLSDGRLVENPDAHWAITETTRADLRGVVRDLFSVEDGQVTLRDVEDRIERAGIFSDTRATMIARTEISRAQVQGNVATWKESGQVETVRWQLSGDHDHDDECDENAAGSPYKLDEIPDFPAHPNCECVLVIDKFNEAPAPSAGGEAPAPVPRLPSPIQMWTPKESFAATLKNAERAFKRGSNYLSKMPDFIHDDIQKMADAGLNPKISEKLRLARLEIRDAPAGMFVHKPGFRTLGYYMPNKRLLNVSPESKTTQTFIHEFGHHVDFRFDSAATLKSVGYDVFEYRRGRSGMRREFRTAVNRAKKLVGVTPENNYEDFYRPAIKMVGIEKIAPSIYSMQNRREWFAETFMEYTRGSQARARLKSVAPKTFEHIDKIFKGGYAQ